MSIKGQGHSLTLVKGHSDFKVKCVTFGLYTQVSDSGPHGPLVVGMGVEWGAGATLLSAEFWFYKAQLVRTNFLYPYQMLSFYEIKSFTRALWSVFRNALVNGYIS